MSSFKINLSDRKIGAILEFFDNLPLPTSNTLPLTVTDCSYLTDIDSNLKKMFKNDQILYEKNINEMAELKRKIVVYYLYHLR